MPFGMRGLSTPTIEAFYRRGLLHKLTPLPSAKKADGAPAVHWMHQTRRPGGHFAGIQFFHDNIDHTKWPYRLPSPAPTHMATTMEQVETVLAARAATLGVEIRRGFAVEGFDVSDHGVTIQAGGKRFHGRWLVGCDGGRSTVRKVGGFEFVGTDAEFTGYSVEIELDDPEKLAPGRHYTPNGMYTFQKPGTVAMVDFDGAAFHRSSPITQDHVQTVLRRVTGIDVTLTALRLATTWTDRAYQATTYRRGRVLLAGDAAHIHSPLGGQGLNLGLGDAMNLGWKLAATIGGKARADLLDTYTLERHPIGMQVLDWSRAQVALMRPSQSSRALEAIIRDLIETRDGATYFADRVWGVSLHYDLDGTHPLIGHSSPDFELADETHLGQHFESGKGILLDFDAGKPLQTVGDRWTDYITYIASEPKNGLGLSALLVRPDGIVAWAAESAPDHDAAQAAISRCFGNDI